MPYKCVHCSEVYADSERDLMNGCANCKSKFFFYVREQKLKEIAAQKEFISDLSASEKKQIEKDVRELVGVTDEEMPVFLDFESVKIVKPGKYLLDLQKLFAQDKPRIYKLDDGKYIIDLNMRVADKKRI